MTMNGEGTQEWARLTGENIGKCIAIVLDGYVYSAPRVNTKIDKGSSQITGDFTIQEAKDLANVLNSGKVPLRPRSSKIPSWAPRWVRSRSTRVCFRS